MEVRFEPARVSHVYHIMAHIREADRVELEDATGVLSSMVIARGIGASDAIMSYIDDKPIAVYGVVPVSAVESVGVPWMVGTNYIADYKVKFGRHSQDVVAAWKNDYNYLFNYVDDRNTTAKDWLGWLGFTLDDPAPYGAANKPFRRFEWRA